MTVATVVPDESLGLSFSPRSAGRNLGHNYQGVCSIGRGSFGLATLAKDGQGKLYVIKTIDLQEHDEKHQLDAVNEVKVLSSLKHPYIVRYHESFVENSTLSIVMDYAEGGDLARRIGHHREKQRLFAEGQVLHWFTQVVLGLKYLHNMQIIHRDLKPQNIFLTKQDDLRLGDFGISKILGGRSLNKEEKTIGTPYYFSPEICHERLYSFASDIWALGCILYELLALRVPFEAQNILGLIVKITECKPDALPSAFSSDVRMFCLELLNRNYSRRPSAAVILQKPMIQIEVLKMLEGTAAKLDPKSPSLSRGLLRVPAPASKRSPSAPGLSSPGGNVLRRSGSNVLNSSTGAIGAKKSAWPEMIPLPKECEWRCNKDSFLTIKPVCAGASPTRRMGASRCGASRARTRRGIGGPAFPVWQEVSGM